MADPKALVAVNVILLLAVAVGVPAKTPPELNVMPAGKAPVLLHVIGEVPVAVKVVVGYSVLTVPATSEEGDVITGAEPLAVLGAPKVGPKGPDRKDKNN